MKGYLAKFSQQNLSDVEQALRALTPARSSLERLQRYIAVQRTPEEMAELRAVRKRRSDILYLTTYAWEKLCYFRQLGSSEFVGFGLSHPSDLLVCEDFLLLPQVASTGGACFDDQGKLDYMDDMTQLGYKMDECTKLWLHKHPGQWIDQSATDLDALERCYGNSEWVIMGIFPDKGNDSNVRLIINAGPGVNKKIDCELLHGFDRPATTAERRDLWLEEYVQQLIIPTADDRARTSTTITVCYSDDDADHGLGSLGDLNPGYEASGGMSTSWIESNRSEWIAAIDDAVAMCTLLENTKRGVWEVFLPSTFGGFYVTSAATRKAASEALFMLLKAACRMPRSKLEPVMWQIVKMCYEHNRRGSVQPLPTQPTTDAQPELALALVAEAETVPTTTAIAGPTGE